MWKDKQVKAFEKKVKGEKTLAKIIAVANQKGGVGKTTTAVNLATAVADLGKRVLLVDLDPQGNATSGLGIEKSALKSSLYEVLLEGFSPRGAILPTDVERLSALPTTVDLAGAEVQLVGMENREYLLKEALGKIDSKFDYIFIDSPPSLGLLTLNGLTAANTVLIPLQCEFYALEGIGQLMNTIALIQKTFNPRLGLEGVLMTMFDGRTNLSNQVVAEAREHFGVKVYDTIIPRTVRLSEAPSFGAPISRYDKNCKGAEVYAQLAEEVVAKNEN